MKHDIITILLLLLITGFVVWAVRKAPFLDALFKQIIIWVVVVSCIVWALAILGLWARIGL